MDESEKIAAKAVAKLEANGRKRGIRAAFPWATILEALLQLFQDCGKEAVKKNPVLAQMRAARGLRTAMPGSGLVERMAVAETGIATLLEASESDVDAFGAISL